MKKDKKQSIFEIGKRLKEEIKKKGYDSQEDFAESIGVAYPTFKNYLSGKSKFDYEILQRISKALNCSYEYILCESDSPNPEYEDAITQTGLSLETVEKLSIINKTAKGNGCSKEEAIITLRLIDTVLDNQQLWTDLVFYILENKPMKDIRNMYMQMIPDEILNKEYKMNTEVEIAIVSNIINDLKNIKDKFRAEMNMYINNEKNKLNEALSQK